MSLRRVVFQYCLMERCSIFTSCGVPILSDGEVQCLYVVWGSEQLKIRFIIPIFEQNFNISCFSQVLMYIEYYYWKYIL